MTGFKGIKTDLLFLILYLHLYRYAVVDAGRWALSKEEDLEIERQLKIINKPYVKSFKSEHGDVFDCVDIYKQQAFDHPLLQNHTIQRRPTLFPKSTTSDPKSRGKFLKTGLMHTCPQGAVLTRRAQKGDMIWAKMHVPYIRPQVQTNDGNHYAGIAVESANDIKYYGAQSLMDVFTLKNVSINQGSSAQIVLSKGEKGPANYLNTIQFGWHVIPQKYGGDGSTRLFTYWTSDGYQNKGCFNLLCAGFVQKSSSWTPGMILPTGRGALKLTTSRDPATGSWWLRIGEDELVGYWPKEIFNNMADCSEIQMGGIIYSPVDEPSPPMGNGVLPHPDPSEACEFKQVHTVNGNGEFEQPEDFLIIPFYDIREYYDVGPYDHPSDGLVFSFGGPGGYKP